MEEPNKKSIPPHLVNLLRDAGFADGRRGDEPPVFGNHFGVAGEYVEGVRAEAIYREAYEEGLNEARQRLYEAHHQLNEAEQQPNSP